VAGWAGAEALAAALPPHHQSRHPHHSSLPAACMKKRAGGRAQLRRGRQGLGKILGATEIHQVGRAEKRVPTVEEVREHQLQDTRLRFLNGTPSAPARVYGSRFLALNIQATVLAASEHFLRYAGPEPCTSL